MNIRQALPQQLSWLLLQGIQKHQLNNYLNEQHGINLTYSSRKLTFRMACMLQKLCVSRSLQLQSFLVLTKEKMEGCSTANHSHLIRLQCLQFQVILISVFIVYIISSRNGCILATTPKYLKTVVVFYPYRKSELPKYSAK